MATLGRNIEFPIYNADGTSFHGLILRKSTYESSVMSLGDKITGDVYYKDNSLDVSMGEYITFNDIDYVLINPPTIVKEGLAKDNNELRGMTKYSFTFYHPMCMLGNFPFSDVAVSSDEEKYKSQDKEFAWIGTPDDFIAKLNKNLQGTTWVVVKSDRFPVEKDGELSEVLTFENDTIADALKTGYETWEVPYIVDKLEAGEYFYTDNNNQRIDYYSAAGGGKRFVVVFGLPSNEIYETEEAETQHTPFVFHYGQGVGLKNNSRTPRNNKIITRIAALGSEDNIPYGYPQIMWYGDPDWEFTAYSNIVMQETIKIGQFRASVGVIALEHPNYEDTISDWLDVVVKADSGEITHDVVRNHPTGTYPYNWSVKIKDDYVDARYEIVNTGENWKFFVTTEDTMFDVFVPEDSTPAQGAYMLYMGIVGGAYVKLIQHPYTRKHLMPSIYSQSLFNKISPYISDGTANPDYDPTTELVDYYDAISDETYQYPNPIIPSAPSYESHEFDDIKPELGYNIAIVDAYPINNDGTRAEDWDSTMDDDGNYIQSYFKMTLPILSFDIYACAAITQEMTLVMRSGACLGCSFPVQVDWDEYKLNFYDEDGNFAPDGAQRNLNAFPKSNEQQITVIVQKDLDTFGTLMPNIYQKVNGESSVGAADGDTFVVIGISLPLSYITLAEERLDDEAKSYMLENNLHYFDYPLKFDEYFLANNTNILEQIRTNTIVRFDYAGTTLELFVKQLSIKYGSSPLPQYEITLTDNVEVVLNQIGQVADDVEKLSSLIALLRQTYSRNVWAEIDKKLSRVTNDTANGLITFLKGIRLGNYQQATRGGQIDESGNADLNNMLVRGNTTQQGDIFFGHVPFSAGATGGAIWEEDQDIRAELDYLTVRKKMSVTEVEIQEVNYVGGSIVLSPADGFTITDVEWDSEDNLFYVYFESLDKDTGEFATPQWTAGDFAFCQKFNVQNSSGDNIIHRWWREVSSVAVITDESSEFYGKCLLWLRNDSGHCESIYDGVSDYNRPMVGDKVVMLGNKSVPERQGAIMLSSAGGTSDERRLLPYIRVYKDINTFNLSNATLVKQISYSGDITRALNMFVELDLGGGQTVTKNFNAIYKQFDDAISQQKDESFRIWQGETEDEPTLENYPAEDWGTDEDPYSEHVGDFYITSDGFCYQFKNFDNEEDEDEFGWESVTDTYLIQFVNQIGEKKRIFPNRPSEDAMYEVGDLWLAATYPDATDIEAHSQDPTWNDRFVGDTYDRVDLVCWRDKDSSFDISDWRISNETHTWVRQWQTASGDTGGASTNHFIGTEFEAIGTSTGSGHNTIYLPKQAAGFRITPTSAAIQLFFKNANNQYKHAELSFNIDENESTAKLAADNIKLEGYTTINGSFGVDLLGNMFAHSGRFGGLVTHEQTIITEDNYEDYGVLVPREYTSGVTTLTAQDYYIDITKCGQHISVIGVDQITTESRIVFQLPFICDYYRDSNDNWHGSLFIDYIADAWKCWDDSQQQLVDINDYTKHYITSRELFKARSYVGCIVSVANYTICPMYILGVKDYGQTYYIVNPMTSVSNFEQLVSLKCVIGAADATHTTSYAGSEEILWEATTMIPRLIMASSINTETYYYVGKEEEYKDTDYYSDDPVENLFDQDVIDNYESGMFDDESNNNLIPDEPPIVQPTLSDVENRYIDSVGRWNNRYYSVIVDVSRATGQYLTSTTGSQYAFLTSYNSTNVTFVSGGSRINGKPDNTLIPNDAVYVYLYLGTSMPTVAPVLTLSTM